MTSAAIDRLNIGLMVLALGIAIALPFELTLFAWAVLGPLHYLTEISWLHDRRYFAEHRADPAILLAILAAVTLGTDLVMGGHTVDALMRWNPELIFGALATGFLVAFVRSWIVRAIGGLAIVAAAAAMHGSLPAIYLFSLYVPTLIHVFVFTGAFILLGALRGKSRVGLLSFGVFLACGALALLSGSIALPFGVSDSAARHFHFDSIVAIVSYHFGLADAPFGMARHAFFPFADRNAIFESPAAIATARFVAFAYTYHYLNWFSKTSVIGWHEIPRARAIAIVCGWLASIGLYFVAFEAGLALLFALSLAHVFLEFPLNARTFASLLGGLVRAPARTAAR
jgi:hypothetical protein